MKVECEHINADLFKRSPSPAFFWAVFLLCCLIAVPGSGRAATFTVTNSDGTATPGSFSEAADNAVSNDVIVFGPGVAAIALERGALLRPSVQVRGMDNGQAAAIRTLLSEYGLTGTGAPAGVGSDFANKVRTALADMPRPVPTLSWGGPRTENSGGTLVVFNRANPGLGVLDGLTLDRSFVDITTPSLGKSGWPPAPDLGVDQRIWGASSAVMFDGSGTINSSAITNAETHLKSGNVIAGAAVADEDYAWADAVTSVRLVGAGAYFSSKNAEVASSIFSGNTGIAAVARLQPEAR